MRCLKEKVLTRYLDGGYSRKDAETIKRHIQDCSGCRKKMEKIKKEIEYINKKIEILSPGDIPERDFWIPDPALGKTESARLSYKRQKIFSFKLSAAAVAILVLCVVSVLWFFLQKKERDTGLERKHLLSIVEQIDGTDTAIEKRNRQSIIRRISIAGQPVQTYIVRDPENKTTLIWVEKKTKRENKNAEKI